MYPASGYSRGPESYNIENNCTIEIEKVLYSTDEQIIDHQPKRTFYKGDPNDKYSTPHDRILPGHIYSPTEQCRIYMGPNGTACDFIGRNACMSFHCSSGNNCKEKRLLDGSSCGHKMECFLRKCVERREILDPKQSFAKLFNYEYKKLLLSVCPNGIISYSENKENVVKENYVRQKYCEQVERRMKRYKIPCRDAKSRPENDFSKECCEHCIKLNYSKCDEHLRGEEIDKEICEEEYCKLSKENAQCQIPTCKEAKNACFNGGTCVTNFTALKYKDATTAFYCKCRKGYFGKNKTFLSAILTIINFQNNFQVHYV
jgi:hypothetical protein